MALVFRMHLSLQVFVSYMGMLPVAAPKRLWIVSPQIFQMAGIFQGREPNFLF